MVGSCKFLYLHLNLALIVYQYVFIVLRNCEIEAARACGGFSGAGAIAGVVKRAVAKAGVKSDRKGAQGRFPR